MKNMYWIRIETIEHSSEIQTEKINALKEWKRVGYPSALNKWIKQVYHNSIKTTCENVEPRKLNALGGIK